MTTTAVELGGAVFQESQALDLAGCVHFGAVFGVVLGVKVVSLS